MKSWQTTISGVIAALGVLFVGLGSLIDGDPATKPVMAEIMAALTALAGIVGIGIFARDNNKNSKAAGAE